MYGGSPYGAAPYSGSSSAGGAISSPITALLAGNLHITLEHILWMQPYDPFSGIVRDLFISAGASLGAWYRTGAGDTFPTGELCEHTLFPAHLLTPPNIETRILSNGEVETGASSYGQCVIADPRREFTQWLSYSWKNARLRYFIGDPTWPLSSLPEVFHGVSTSLAPEIAQMSIGIQDIVAKLSSADYQTQRYAGRGPCIRLDGVDDYLAPATAVTCPAGSMTIGIRVRSRAAITTDQGIAGWHNGFAAGDRRLRTWLSNGIVWSIIDDSGAAHSCLASNVLVPYKWVDLWAVIDTTGMQMLLYNGASPTSPIAQVAISGTYASILSNFTVGRLPDAASNFLAADVDEVTIWAHALTPAEITQWTGQRPPAGTVGLTYQWSMTEAIGPTAYESSDIGAVGTAAFTLTGGAAWVDSLTGGDELKGKCVPKGAGIRRGINPIVISSTDLIYQVAETFDHLDTDISGPLLRDGGIRVWVLKGTYTDPWAATPSPGEYMEIPSLGLIRLGSAPVRALTCDVWLTASATLQSCLQTVALGDGGINVSDFDVASCAALPATSGLGCYAGLDAVKIDAVVTGDLLPSVKAWRSVNGSGQLTFGLIRPPESLTPIAYLTGDDFTMDGVTPVSTLPAARGALIRYRPYTTTQQPANTNPTLTEAEKQDLNQRYRGTPATPDNTTVLAADSSADIAVRETTLDSLADAAEQASVEAEWRSKPRRTDKLVQVAQVPRFQVGQVLFIQMAALDYDDGKNVLVGAVTQDPGTGTYSIEVIGETKIVGLSFMLTGDGSGVALVGDGSGSGVI